MENKEVCTALEKIVTESSLLSLKDAGAFQKAFSMASAIRQLRELITDKLMGEIMPLMNSPLGFLTDKDPARPVWNATTRTKEAPAPYPVSTVRECFIEATLRGFAPIGNEFNIISGRFYAAKAGLLRKVKETPGLTDLCMTVGIPKMSGESGAIVPTSASWKVDGVPGNLAQDFAVKVNAGMGADAIVGKAERRLYAAILNRISGIVTPDGEPEEADAQPEKKTVLDAIRDKAATPEDAQPTQVDPTLAEQFAKLTPPTLAKIKGRLGIKTMTADLTDEQKAQILKESANA